MEPPRPPAQPPAQPPPPPSSPSRPSPPSSRPRPSPPALSDYPGFESSRPYLRWWWLAGPFRREDIAAQLDWVLASGFGGVELAWLDPTWLGRSDLPPRPDWLGEEWSALIGFTKQYADRIGLGCDFTFGSSWPFGGSQVRPEDAAQTFDGPSSQRLLGSWEPGPQRIIDHLSERALRRYAEALAPAFAPGLAGSPSALVCDSLELETERIWSPGLSDGFAERFGYRLEEHTALAQTHPHMRYEYRRHVGSSIRTAFFETFAQICRELGALSRVQCHGAPTDLLAAYAAVDVPESEALLFAPPFTRIAASAAALAGTPLVSAEAFSCLYGLLLPGNLEPARFWRREQVADLKLVADALFANGVNHLVWHGMPYNAPGGTLEFYASVHVGPDAAFARQLPAFNEYLETVAGMLRRGRPYTNLAVYLPLEDRLMRDRIPADRRTPGAVYEWELRDAIVPPETEGYHPLWVSEPFLQAAEVVDGQIVVGAARFSALYLDCAWLDAAALEQVARLAQAGAPVVLKRPPALPGMRRNPCYAGWLSELAGLPNVRAALAELAGLGVRPLVSGPDLPWYWARQAGDELLIFFAHPLARGVRYPLAYGQSFCEGTVERPVTLHVGAESRQTTLVFEPYQSLLVRVTPNGRVEPVDVTYRPETPTREPPR